MSSSCDIVIDRQASQRNSPRNCAASQQATTPSMKIPMTQYNNISSAHPYLNNNNNRHFTATDVMTNSSSNNNIHNVNSNNYSPMAGLALSPSANSDNQLHFGSPFQNFYKLVRTGFFVVLRLIDLVFNRFHSVLAQCSN